MNLFRTPFILPWIYPTLLWKLPTREKEIYLTFDDGPVPDVTLEVLKELERTKAQATFFCIGDNVQKHPEVFQQIIEQKHAIGNHTFNHLKGWTTNTDAYVKNVKQCEDSFILHGKSEGKLFRPPYGRITKNQIESLSEYTIVMWDVLTHDYNATLGQEYILRKSIEATRPGSIIVFHDSVKAYKNLSYVLPRYLDHFLNLGFEFKSLPG